MMIVGGRGRVEGVNLPNIIQSKTVGEKRIEFKL